MDASAVRVAASLRRGARWAFYAAIVVSPFRWRFVFQSRPTGTVYGGYTDFLIAVSDIAVLATLALWGSAVFCERRFAPLRRRAVPAIFAAPGAATFATPLGAPLAALTVVAFITATFSIDPALSLYHAIRVVALFALFLYLAAGEVSWRSLAFPAALMVFIQATVALAQFFQQGDVGFTPRFGELRLDPASNGVSIVFAEGRRWLRAYGLTDHPNLLGGCLAFALLLVGAGHASSKGTSRTLLVGAFIAGALALLVTFSRAAWIAFGAGAAMCVALLLGARRRSDVIAWLALGTITLAVLFPFLVRYRSHVGVRLSPPDAQERSEDEGRSIYERGVLNDASVALFAARPLTGVGLGALPTAMSLAYPALTVNYQPAHLVPLTVAAETGVLGAGAYLALAAAPWLALARHRRRLKPTPALIGASGLLLALTVISLLDYYPWVLLPGRFWQWSAWGMWSAAFWRSREACRGRDA